MNLRASALLLLVDILGLGFLPRASAHEADDPSALPRGVVARGGTPRLHNGRSATSLAFAPDGKTLASGDEDGRAHLWDRSSGKEIRRFEGHEDDVWCVV